MSPETLVDNGILVWGLASALVALVVIPYLLQFRRREEQDRQRKAEAARLGIDRPVAQYPYIDPQKCIGCATCVDVCPEGDVLGVVGGVAVVINGLRCIGIARCEEACPVGAIEVGLGDLKARADMPLLDDQHQTSVPGIFIAGELGGLALVRNAALQAREALEQIGRRVADSPGGESDIGVLDVAIVGAGPAGLRAGLAAAASGLSYVLLEREESLGGTVLKYPRRKLVLTQPVDFAPFGILKGGQYRKERLLEVFEAMVRKADLEIAFSCPVESVHRQNGHFVLQSGPRTFRSRFVLLALGRRGTPRKLGVKGEELPKVMYRLMDAESYRNERILVVGGGDSAIEAAIGLSRQTGNEVILSYRKPKLVRVKKRNQERVEELIAKGGVRPLFSSQVLGIEEGSVRLRVEEREEIEVENDYVFVFAGGVPPLGFLKEMGIRFGGGNDSR
jgi:thioredoxin reductase